MGGIEVGRLAGVHDRAAADGDVAVELAFRGEPRRGLEAVIGRFDPHLGVDLDVHAGLYETLFDGLDMRQLDDGGVGEKGDALHGEALDMVAGFGQAAGTEGDGRGVDGKGLVAGPRSARSSGSRPWLDSPCSVPVVGADSKGPGRGRASGLDGVQ